MTTKRERDTQILEATKATWRCYVVESNDRSLFLCICLSLSSAGSSGAVSACSSCEQRGLLWLDCLGCSLQWLLLVQNSSSTREELGS